MRSTNAPLGTSDSTSRIGIAVRLEAGRIRWLGHARRRQAAPPSRCRCASALALNPSGSISRADVPAASTSTVDGPSAVRHSTCTRVRWPGSSNTTRVTGQPSAVPLPSGASRTLILGPRQVLAGNLKRKVGGARGAVGAQQPPAIEDAAARVVVDHAVPADARVARRSRERDGLDQIRRLLVGGDAAGGRFGRGGVVLRPDSWSRSARAGV